MAVKKIRYGLKDLGRRCGTASLLGLTILLSTCLFPKASPPPPSEPVGEKRGSIAATVVPITLAPTPTPAVQPAERLNAARIHQQNGDYLSAIAEYKAVLASESLRPAQGGASQAQMEEARYYLGESYLASDSY
ncbi:MAG: hypothetical protein OEW09_16665, partial [Anaerolineae bacterium]|nr:hypothetical protein [Anaerolineae bacterium]